MIPLVELRDAALGWLDLLGRGEASAANRFNATPTGFVTMLVWYLGLVLLTRIIQGLTVAGSFPGISDLAVALALNSMPMLAIILVIVLTHRALRPAASLLAMLVPAGYALVLLLVVGMPLSLFVGSALAPALQGLLGYMLFRLARDIGQLGTGISVAFAVLTVVLLVAIPIGLYMLLMPELPTPS